MPLEGEQISVPARTARPISRIAENVTVVTAEQITAFNAHTLAEVLQNISGIQLQQIRTPGSWVGFHVNGLSFEHVLVVLDGIVQNDLLNNFPDVGLIPARQIERVEIIKGSASAAWGPALGGVVNIITKSAEPDRKGGGSALASYGEKGTTELNAEVSGTLDRFGYYFAGGNLHSRGLLPGNGINFNHAWGKLSYSLPSSGTITFGGNLRDAFRGLEESAPLNYRDTDDLLYYHLFADYSQPLVEGLTLDLSARHRNQWNRTIWGSIVLDPELPPYAFTGRQIVSSSTAKIFWDKQTYSLLAGTDFEHHDIRTSTPDDRTLNRWSAYLNGSYTSGPFTLLPGIRFDHTALAQNPTSYTLGATWQLSDKTIVRGYAAKGYGLPNLSISKQLQNIKTIQLGMESGDVPYVWLKSTLFYNYIWNIEPPGDPSAPKIKEIRQGIELEARTIAFQGFSLSSGYTYSDCRDRDTHKTIPFTPEQSLKLGLNYNGRFGLSGALTGNYVWWNDDSSYKGHYSPIVWDLNLTQKLLPDNELSPEIYFSGHNLFNGSQYTSDLYKSVPRWLEGGVRFRF